VCRADSRLVHGHIASRAARFRALAAAAAAEINADAGVLSDAPVVVSLREFIGRRVTAISGGALGDEGVASGNGPGLPMANDAMGTSAFVVHGMHGVLLLDAVGLLPLLWRLVVRPLARFSRARLRHEQLLQQWLHSSGASFAQQLLAAGSETEAMGHLWVMTLGSTVPETVITCRILYELALAPPAEQDAVARLFFQEDAEAEQQQQEADQQQQQQQEEEEAGEAHPSLRRSGSGSGGGRSGADAWIDLQLSRHLFFSQSSKHLEADTTLRDGTTLHKGDIIGFNYGRMALDSGHSMPFGFGRRGCPGASIGRGIVKAMVGAVVRNYRLSREADSALGPLSFWRDGLSSGRKR
jgi:hypothetical protein